MKKWYALVLVVALIYGYYSWKESLGWFGRFLPGSFQASACAPVTPGVPPAVQGIQAAEAVGGVVRSAATTGGPSTAVVVEHVQGAVGMVSTWWRSFESAARGGSRPVDAAAYEVAAGKAATALQVAAASCTCPPGGGSGGGAIPVVESPGPVGVAGLSSAQVRVAQAWIAGAMRAGVPTRGQVVGVAAGLVETDLLNLASRAVPESMRYPNDGVAAGDHDSVGIAQQRAGGWGSVAERMTPATAADMFYRGGRGGAPGLLDKPGWESMTVGQAAQAVQVSAFPARYDAVASRAAGIVQALAPGFTPQPPVPSMQVALKAAACVPAGPSAPTQPIGAPPVGTRSVTDPTSGRTYAVPIPAGPAGVAVNAALDHLGLRYVWGGTSITSGMDCSAYTQWSWGQAGVSIPRVSSAQAAGLPAVSGLWRGGDLVHKPGHIAMYVGTVGGVRMIVEEPRTGLASRLVPLWFTPDRVVRPGGAGIV